MLLAITLLQGVNPLVKGFVLEGGGDRHVKVIQQLVHIVTKLAALAGLKAERLGPARLIEVVDVTPVLRGGLFVGVLFQVMLDDGVFSQAMGTGEEQVIALALDPDAELHRLDGPLLANVFGNLFEIGGGFKIQQCGLAMPKQFFCGQFTTHLFSPERFF